MSKRGLFSPAFLRGFLSAFDISGTISPKTREILSKGPEDDMQQLMDDQKRLYEDYKKATERVMKTML